MKHSNNIRLITLVNFILLLNIREAGDKYVEYKQWLWEYHKLSII